ncbi:MAG: amidohydrolase family protein [Acidaminococcales bacterium]|jgi:predicted amidohydrolase|nr:amidohydrolase family protein [Acidaminococcales bacterium]
MLRAGDVFCHVHQGAGHTILGNNGKVLPEIAAAQKRGVIFDAANGRNNFSFTVAQQAIQEGFLPDVISSDLTAKTLYGDFVFGLPYVMMKYLNMGMQLQDVIASCTSNPARQMGLSGKIGTLAPGAFADVAVFRHIRKKYVMHDNSGKSIEGEHLLLPQLTVLNGKVVFRSIEF